MFRFAPFCGLLFVLTTGVSCFGQAMPPWHQRPCPPMQPWTLSPRPAAVVRTVQVDVPAPCPQPWNAMRHGDPRRYGPPACAPQCPTRPVDVRVEVRVRPEPCGSRRPNGQECRDLGALRPLVNIFGAAMAAPIRFLESISPLPARCHMPRPVCCPPHPCPPQGWSQIARHPQIAPYLPGCLPKPQKVRPHPTLAPLRESRRIPWHGAGPWGKEGLR